WPRCRRARQGRREFITLLGGAAVAWPWLLVFVIIGRLNGQGSLMTAGSSSSSSSFSASSSSSSSSFGSRGGSTPMIVTRLRSTNQAEMLSGGVMSASHSPTDVSAQGKLGNPGRCGVDLRLVEELGDALVSVIDRPTLKSTAHACAPVHRPRKALA